MSLFNILLASCCVVLSVFLSNVHCDSVISGKTYVIRSATDGGYLNTLGNGKSCEKLSGIVATRRSNTDPFPNEYKWLVEYLQFGKDIYAPTYLITHFVARSKQYWLQKQGLDHGHLFNEISLYSPPPSCFATYRSLQLLPDASKTSYEIVNLRDEKCLSYNGPSGGPASWQTCGGSDAQKWIFQETTPADE